MGPTIIFIEIAPYPDHGTNIIRGTIMPENTSDGKAVDGISTIGRTLWVVIAGMSRSIISGIGLIRTSVERSQPNLRRKERKMTRKLISVQQVIDEAQDDGIEPDALYVDPNDILALDEDDSDSEED